MASTRIQGAQNLAGPGRSLLGAGQGRWDCCKKQCRRRSYVGALLLPLLCGRVEPGLRSPVMPGSRANPLQKGEGTWHRPRANYSPSPTLAQGGNHGSKGLTFPRTPLPQICCWSSTSVHCGFTQDSLQCYNLVQILLEITSRDGGFSAGAVSTTSS